MPFNKITSGSIEDGTVASIDFAPGTVTNDKLVNTTFTINSQSITLGSSGSINVNDIVWQSVKTTDFTAVAGEGYFVDTSSAAVTITLPASASLGDTIAIKDYAGTFATNNCTIDRNSHNIQGSATNSILQNNRASVVLVYADATKGWLYVDEHNVANLQTPHFITATGGTITTTGNFKVHTFTSSGCFTVSQIGNSPTVPTGGPANVDYLVIAGGGAGNPYGGGGGAGGHRTSFPSPGCNAGAFPISVTTYPITVGAGASVPSPRGSNSVFSTITSTGGGNGGFANNAVTGGSGGGCGMASSPGNTGAAGNTPPVSPPQGNPGGAARIGPGIGDRAGGGGGGAGGAGNPSPGPNVAGNGGNGTPNSITGSAVTRAGGGGGSTDSRAGSAGTAGTGGPGGGGNGVNGISPTNKVGFSATANTGSGGGAGTIVCGGGLAYGPGGSGGSGIVIIRYKYQ